MDNILVVDLIKFINHYDQLNKYSYLQGVYQQYQCTISKFQSKQILTSNLSASKPFDSIENYHKVNTKTSSILDLLKNNNNQNQKKSTLELMQIRGKNGIASQGQQKLTYSQEEQKAQSMQNTLKRRSSIAHVGFTLNKNVPIRTVEINAVGKRRIKYQQGQQHQRKISADDAYLKSQRDSEDDIFNEPETILKTQILKTPSQSEIRKLLHPDISKSCLEVREIWIPGHLHINYLNFCKFIYYFNYLIKIFFWCIRELKNLRRQKNIQDWRFFSIYPKQSNEEMDLMKNF